MSARAVGTAGSAVLETDDRRCRTQRVESTHLCLPLVVYHHVLLVKLCNFCVCGGRDGDWVECDVEAQSDSESTGGAVAGTA